MADYDYEVMRPGSAPDPADDEIAELRAELDRLREALDEKSEQSERLGNALEATASRGAALAAESAGLRAIIARMEATVDGTLCMDGAARQAALSRIAAQLKDAAELQPSPLTAAVERVLEAVGRAREAYDDWDHAFDPDEVQRHWDRYEDARFDAFAAHDALRALLEGREGAP